jgi:glutamate N-acetyltransferase/amino-acid N-acetyltransferase
MFCFIVSNAAVEPAALRPLLKRVADRSLNAVSVDGDMSPDDMMLLWASGTAGNARFADGSPGLAAFEAAVLDMARWLARQIARDGEGATRLIEITVSGAASFEQALAAARGVAVSPLVKSAVHGRDPNWGRILSAVGQSGVDADLERAAVSLAGWPVFRDGHLVPFDAAAVSDAMAGDSVAITVDLGVGDAVAQAWGCDLSADYVHINSDYTT